MNILRVAPSFYPKITGPANQVYHVSNILETIGYHNKLIYPINKRKINELDPNKIKNQINFSIYPVEIPFSIMRYGVPFKSNLSFPNNINVVHIHQYRYNLSELALKYSLKNNLPIIFQTHGSLFSYKYVIPRHYQLIYKTYDLFWKKKFLNSAKKIIVSTDLEKKEAIEFGFNKLNIEKIAIGYDKLLLETAKKLKSHRDNDKITISFIGRICKSRNPLLLIKAFEEIQTHYDVELRIIGGPVKRSSLEKINYYENILKYCDKKDLSVTFTGFLKGRDLYKEYGKTDIFVYPTIYENLGQPIFEAATAGCCIISSKTGIASELISKNARGLLLDKISVNDIKRNLVKLLEKPSLIRQFGRRIQDFVIENYKWNQIINKYVSIYQEIV